MDAAGDLEQFLSNYPAAEVHLTLSATTKPADLRRAVERFTRFRPTRLVFTRLDETSSFGPIWSESVRQGWPLSFLSEGQQIPEDLREADAEWLANQIAGEWVEEPTPMVASQPAMPMQDPPEQSTPWLASAFLPLQKPVWTGVSAG
jgi:flagellar biosynthesis GTPase FlhF